MEIAVLTPDKEIFQGAITSISVPGAGGRFEILNNHAPIVSALAEGKVKIKKEAGGIMEFNIEKGFLEVLNNKLSLLVQGVDIKE